MTLIRICAVLALSLSLSGCGSRDLPSMPAADGLDVASKNDVPGVSAAGYRLAGLTIDVPDSLRVSEANGFYPIADIVWRGEPLADRHAQVEAIFAEGIRRGMAGVTTGRPAVAEVEVLRFHCLTEKTRYTVGGVHSIRFMLTLRDPATGRVLDGPRKVVADVKASGGTKAVADDAAGRTQRVVIVEALARVFRRELGGGSAVPAVASVVTATVAVAPPIVAEVAVPVPPIIAAAPLVAPATPKRIAGTISPWDWIDLPPARLLN